eukprot:353393-Chlamydomonas_euryale.AAC.3
MARHHPLHRHLEAHKRLHDGRPDGHHGVVTSRLPQRGIPAAATQAGDFRAAGSKERGEVAGRRRRGCPF